jgi:hypothetical protein
MGKHDQCKADVLLSLRGRDGDKTMRALAAAIALSLLTIAALAASPQVEAALNAFRTVGTDANRLKTFCELMEIEEENLEKAAPSVEAKMDKLLDELGADFKAAWKSVEDVDPASDDGTVLYAALNQLLEKCSG